MRRNIYRTKLRQPVSQLHAHMTLYRRITVAQIGKLGGRILRPQTHLRALAGYAPFIPLCRHYLHCPTALAAWSKTATPTLGYPPKSVVVGVKRGTEAQKWHSIGRRVPRMTLRQGQVFPSRLSRHLVNWFHRYCGQVDKGELRRITSYCEVPSPTNTSASPPVPKRYPVPGPHTVSHR